MKRSVTASFADSTSAVPSSATPKGSSLKVKTPATPALTETWSENAYARPTRPTVSTQP